MAAVMVANHSQHVHKLASPSTQEYRKNLSPHGSKQTQRVPMSTISSDKPAGKPAGKPAPVPRGKRERPCDACRRRKSKCVVNEGTKVCTACGTHGQDCTYVEDPQPRKRKTEGEQNSEAAKRRSRASPSSGTSSPPLLTRQASVLSSTRPTSSSSKPQLPTVPASHVPEQECGIHVGLTTEMEPLLLQLTSSTSSPLNSIYALRGSLPFFTNPSTAEVDSASQESLKTLNSIISPYGSLFLQIYLANVHPAFPILSSSFFEAYDTNPTILSPIILSAIFTSTIPFLKQSHFPSQASIPDLAALETLAVNLFSDSLSNPSLATIQAGILLMQRPGIDTRALNTQLVTAAHDLGLQVDCSNWGLPTSDVRTRTRLAWAVYIQDKWSALVHGRPSLITAANWSVPALTHADIDPLPLSALPEANEALLQDQEEHPALPARSGEIFIELVRLSTILSTILDTFYTLQAQAEVLAQGANATRLILDRAKPVQIRLKEWYSGLKAHLRMDTASFPSSTRTNSDALAGATAFLHLAYFAAEISLHRCIIRSLHPSLPSSSSSSAAASPLSGPSRSPDPTLQHICRSAAKTRLISAMDFLNRLRPRHRCTLALYFPSAACFALPVAFGALLRATAPAAEEERFYELRGRELRWTLAVSAGSVDVRSAEGEEQGQGTALGVQGDMRAGSVWLAEAVAWVDTWDELCASLPSRPSAADLAVLEKTWERETRRREGRVTPADSRGEGRELGLRAEDGYIRDGEDGDDGEGAEGYGEGYGEDAEGHELDLELARGRRDLEAEMEDVQAVRFVRIADRESPLGETGLASPSVSSESGSFEWAGRR